MNILTVTGIGIVGTLLGIVIRQYKPEYGVFVSLATGIVLMTITVTVITPVTDAIATISDRVGIDGEYITPLFKALAVCYVTQLAADCCRDAGETAIAGKVELCGRTAILLVSLPLFNVLVNTVTTLIR